ncbi:unnamed protein product [Moneuplotes crassus]|uniref:Uncharacterized protein n=1 Tax=Euplotes crassus TaxID=5936 RepID=A0AAD1X7U0_EUPCR|nr:unnamed protein product [Moneuplotes crassus]
MSCIHLKGAGGPSGRLKGSHADLLGKLLGSSRLTQVGRYTTSENNYPGYSSAVEPKNHQSLSFVNPYANQIFQELNKPAPRSPDDSLKKCLENLELQNSNLKQKLKRNINQLERHQSSQSFAPQIPNTISQSPWMQSPMLPMPPAYMNHQDEEDSEEERRARKKKRKDEKKLRRKDKKAKKRRKEKRIRRREREKIRKENPDISFSSSNDSDLDTSSDDSLMDDETGSAKK